MCLIVFAWQPGHALPLLVAANRDEFYARPSLPLAAWEDAEGVFAGRDLEAGGTWLGLGPAGRFAALTNVRDPSQALGKRSVANWWRTSCAAAATRPTTWRRSPGAPRTIPASTCSLAIAISSGTTTPA